ncbi:retrovirus-related pol polyprotein from transposon TNT 1-94 [Tanacetum coccineum]|uniref:Retrovirus-related pol polyprotein from transposon TNT 1-94 n=1 Tax=Tanacetum coccineum TaxID=301880 RepID=A0ABQ4YV08_9ASTR
MSTSKTYQQSLVDSGSENMPPMLERGSYIPWASRFRRYLNRKRDNRKLLLKALDEGPYEFKNFVPEGSTIPRLQTAEDLEGDDLLLHDAEMEVMNMILLSIPNEIYNSVDACTSAKDMWKRVERLMRGTIQNKVDRETYFTNEFDQFVVEPGESLVSVYNRFAQLMNDLERNNMNFPTVTINTKFLNSLQPEWLKYVTQVRLAKRLTVDSFDDLFYYLQQFVKLVNASRAKKLEKSHDPLALVVHTGDRVNIQSRNSGNTIRNSRRAYVQEEVVKGMNAPKETGNVQRTLRTPSSGNTSTVQCYNCSGKGHYARNCPKPRVRDSKYFMEQMLLAKQDEAGVILTDEQNDFLFADASRMEEIEELSANICLMARIQPADHTSDDGPSYESAFISEVQSSSIDENNEPMYPTHTKIINSTIGDDQINSNIKFDSFKGNVNSGSVEKDTHVPDLCAVEKLARNAYQEAEKQRSFVYHIELKDKIGKSLKKVVQIVPWVVDSGCSKHMTGHCTQLLALDNIVEGDLEIGLFVLIHVTYEIWKEMICSQVDAILICILSPFLTWLLLHPFVSCPKQLQQSHGYVTKDSHMLIRGKSKKASHPPKLVPSDHSKLELLHMDLCGPMSETPEIIKKFITQAQLNYKAKFCKIRTDNGTEFKNATLKAYYEKLGIMQQFLIAQTPQQKGVVERRNRTLVEAARTMLIFSKLPEFLWAKAVATVYFTQNRSIIHTRYNKTPYELLRGQKPKISYFHVFGSLCYPTNDRDDLRKMKPKADIGVFIGYSETSTEPKLQRFNNHISSEEQTNTPSKEDLDNLFGLLFEEYYEQKSSDTPIYSAAQPTQVYEDSPSTSSIIHMRLLLLLKKALYGLKQAPRAWYDKLSSFIIEHRLTKEFQSQYAIELLKKHGLDECVSMSTPMATERLDVDLQGTPTDQMTYRRMIGGLMYLTTSRPDITFATFICARYQARPMVKHLKEVKRIFRYLRQSYNMGLWYPKDSGFKLIAYSDADHAGCKDDCKSTSGGLQFLGGKLVSWSSKKQDCTAMSTAEAEYVSLSACCAQVIWMHTQLLDYGYKCNRIPMYYDSKSAIAISYNPIQHSKMKHIDIRYHFIKEHVEKGNVEIYFVGTEYQLADLFTKALPKERFEYLVHRIDMGLIIMAQQQHAAHVLPDELCPPNKRYDLMDANKKVDLDHVQCLSESKILTNIIKDHPLRFSIAASSSVPWIYMARFWHTLMEDGSKYWLRFMLDKKELTLTLDEFRQIFHLP